MFIKLCTGPSLSLDALLKGYGKKIDLFDESQSDMYLFVEKMIRVELV